MMDFLSTMIIYLHWPIDVFRELMLRLLSFRYFWLKIFSIRGWFERPHELIRRPVLFVVSATLFLNC